MDSPGGGWSGLGPVPVRRAATADERQHGHRRPRGAYQQFAERLKEELAKEGFELNLVPTSGSRDNLQRLLANDPQVEIALVQSGLERQLTAEEQRQLESLGAIYQEPLWLFFRRDVELDRIADLLPLRLGLGGEGSGTRAASDAILGANAIEPEQYPESWQSIGVAKLPAR